MRVQEVVPPQLGVLFDGAQGGTRNRLASAPYVVDPDNEFMKGKVITSIAVTGNNPFNLTVSDSPWRGKGKPRFAANHNFETFSDPIMGFRAGFLNHITHNNRNIESGRKNSIYTLLQEATPYEQNKEWWDGGGPQRLASSIPDVGLHDHIDLRNQREGRAFAKAVANMEIGSRGDPWGIYDDALDMVYGELGQGVPARPSRVTLASD